jgi:hypothetical protein
MVHETGIEAVNPLLAAVFGPICQLAVPCKISDRRIKSECAMLSPLWCAGLNCGRTR